jgi:hypothetical protein
VKEGAREAEFAREILSRLPLAEAVLSLWRWVADPLFVLSLFARHRGQGYEKEISLGVVVQLSADALLEHQGSGRKSFTRAREEGLLTVSVQAVYQKFSRIPLGLSEAWLAESTARLRPLYPEAAQLPRAPALRELKVIIVDGKSIKRVAKRLKPLRGRKGGVLAFMTWGVATTDEKGEVEGYIRSGHSGPEVESPWCREPVREPDPRASQAPPTVAASTQSRLFTRASSPAGTGRRGPGKYCTRVVVAATCMPRCWWPVC